MLLFDPDAASFYESASTLTIADAAVPAATFLPADQSTFSHQEGRPALALFPNTDNTFIVQNSHNSSPTLTTSKFSGAAGKRPCDCPRTKGLRRGQSPSPLSRTVIR